MSQLLTKTALLAALLFGAGCSGDDDAEPNRRFISFQMNGKVMLSEQRNMVAYSPGNTADTDPTNDNAQMLIQGYTYNKDAINIYIVGNGPELTPGVYNNAQPGNAFTLEKFSTMELLRADESTGDWNIIIYEVKDNLVIGEFQGTAVSMDQGTVHTITRGYFKLKYQTTALPPATPTP